MRIMSLGLLGLCVWIALMPLSVPQVILSCGLYGRDCKAV